MNSFRPQVVPALLNGVSSREQQSVSIRMEGSNTMVTDSTLITRKAPRSQKTSITSTYSTNIPPTNRFDELPNIGQSLSLRRNWSEEHIYCILFNSVLFIVLMAFVVHVVSLKNSSFVKHRMLFKFTKNNDWCGHLITKPPSSPASNVFVIYADMKQLKDLDPKRYKKYIKIWFAVNTSRQDTRRDVISVIPVVNDLLYATGLSLSDNSAFILPLADINPKTLSKWILDNHDSVTSQVNYSATKQLLQFEIYLDFQENRVRVRACPQTSCNSSPALRSYPSISETVALEIPEEDETLLYVVGSVKRITKNVTFECSVTDSHLHGDVCWKLNRNNTFKPVLCSDYDNISSDELPLSFDDDSGDDMGIDQPTESSYTKSPPRIRLPGKVSTKQGKRKETSKLPASINETEFFGNETSSDNDTMQPVYAFGNFSDQANMSDDFEDASMLGNDTRANLTAHNYSLLKDYDGYGDGDYLNATTEHEVSSESNIEKIQKAIQEIALDTLSNLLGVAPTNDSDEDSTGDTSSVSTSLDDVVSQDAENVSHADYEDNKATESFDNAPTANESFAEAPSTNESFANTPSATESFAGTPSATESSADSPFAIESFVGAASANESFTDASSATQLSVDAASANESSVDAPSANESFIDAPTATESFVGAPSANESFIDGPSATESFVDAASANESFADAPSATQSFTDAPSATQLSVDAASANESLTDALPATESFAEAPTATESFVGAPSATETFVVAASANESFAEAASANESFADTPPATESFAGAPSATESFADIPSANESSTDAPFATEFFAGTPSANDSFVDAPPENESFTDAPFATESSIDAASANESFADAPSATEYIAGAPPTTESFVDGASDAESFENAAFSTKFSDDAPSTAEFSDDAIFATDFLDQAPYTAEDASSATSSVEEASPATERDEDAFSIENVSSAAQLDSHATGENVEMPVLNLETTHDENLSVTATQDGGFPLTETSSELSMNSQAEEDNSLHNESQAEDLGMTEAHSQSFSQSEATKESSLGIDSSLTESSTQDEISIQYTPSKTNPEINTSADNGSQPELVIADTNQKNDSEQSAVPSEQFSTSDNPQEPLIQILNDSLEHSDGFPELDLVLEGQSSAQGLDANETHRINFTQNKKKVVKSTIRPLKPTTAAISSGDSSQPEPQGAQGDAAAQDESTSVGRTTPERDVLDESSAVEQTEPSEGPSFAYAGQSENASFDESMIQRNLMMNGSSGSLKSDDGLDEEVLETKNVSAVEDSDSVSTELSQAAGTSPQNQSFDEETHLAETSSVDVEARGQTSTMANSTGASLQHGSTQTSELSNNGTSPQESNLTTLPISVDGETAGNFVTTGGSTEKNSTEGVKLSTQVNQTLNDEIPTGVEQNLASGVPSQNESTSGNDTPLQNETISEKKLSEGNNDTRSIEKSVSPSAQTTVKSSSRKKSTGRTKLPEDVRREEFVTPLKSGDVSNESSLEYESSVHSEQSRENDSVQADGRPTTLASPNSTQEIPFENDELATQFGQNESVKDMQEMKLPRVNEFTAQSEVANETGSSSESELPTRNETVEQSAAVAATSLNKSSALGDTISKEELTAEQAVVHEEVNTTWSQKGHKVEAIEEVTKEPALVNETHSTAESTLEANVSSSVEIAAIQGGESFQYTEVVTPEVSTANVSHSTSWSTSRFGGNMKINIKVKPPVGEAGNEDLDSVGCLVCAIGAVLNDAFRTTPLTESGNAEKPTTMSSASPTTRETSPASASTRAIDLETSGGSQRGDQQQTQSGLAQRNELSTAEIATTRNESTNGTTVAIQGGSLVGEGRSTRRRKGYTTVRHEDSSATERTALRETELPKQVEGTVSTEVEDLLQNNEANSEKVSTQASSDDESRPLASMTGTPAHDENLPKKNASDDLIWYNAPPGGKSQSVELVDEAEIPPRVSSILSENVSTRLGEDERVTGAQDLSEETLVTEAVSTFNHDVSEEFESTHEDEVPTQSGEAEEMAIGEAEASQTEKTSEEMFSSVRVDIPAFDEFEEGKPLRQQPDSLQYDEVLTKGIRNSGETEQEAEKSPTAAPSTAYRQASGQIEDFGADYTTVTRFSGAESTNRIQIMTEGAERPTTNPEALHENGFLMEGEAQRELEPPSESPLITNGFSSQTENHLEAGGLTVTEDSVQAAEVNPRESSTLSAPHHRSRSSSRRGINKPSNRRPTSSRAGVSAQNDNHPTVGGTSLPESDLRTSSGSRSTTPVKSSIVISDADQLPSQASSNSEDEIPTQLKGDEPVTSKLAEEDKSSSGGAVFTTETPQNAGTTLEKADSTAYGKQSTRSEDSVADHTGVTIADRLMTSSDGNKLGTQRGSTRGQRGTKSLEATGQKRSTVDLPETRRAIESTRLITDDVVDGSGIPSQTDKNPEAGILTSKEVLSNEGEDRSQATAVDRPKLSTARVPLRRSRSPSRHGTKPVIGGRSTKSTTGVSAQGEKRMTVTKSQQSTIDFNGPYRSPWDPPGTGTKSSRTVESTDDDSLLSLVDSVQEDKFSSVLEKDKRVSDEEKPVIDSASSLKYEASSEGKTPTRSGDVDQTVKPTSPKTKATSEATSTIRGGDGRTSRYDEQLRTKPKSTPEKQLEETMTTKEALHKAKRTSKTAVHEKNPTQSRDSVGNYRGVEKPDRSTRAGLRDENEIATRVELISGEGLAARQTTQRGKKSPTEREATPSQAEPITETIWEPLIGSEFTSNTKKPALVEVPDSTEVVPPGDTSKSTGADTHKLSTASYAPNRNRTTRSLIGGKSTAGDSVQDTKRITTTKSTPLPVDLHVTYRSPWDPRVRLTTRKKRSRKVESSSEDKFPSPTKQDNKLSTIGGRSSENNPLSRGGSTKRAVT